MSDGFGISFEFEGVAEVKAALEKEKALKAERTRAAVGQGLHAIEAAAKSHFSGSHKKGEPHVGGSEPNVVSGLLRRSITTEGPTEIGPFTWSGKAGPTAVYSRTIELGLRQAPGLNFPYFTPGFEEAREKVARLFEDAWS